MMQLLLPIIHPLFLALGFAYVPADAAGGPAAALPVPDAAREAAPAAAAGVLVDVREDGGELVVTIGGERCTLEELGELMGGLAAADPDLAVRIRGDAGMSWQRMADVISTCSQAGVWNISFTKQTPGSGKDAAAPAPSVPPTQL